MTMRAASVGGSAPLSARVIALPGAAAAPVVNPKRSGRLPGYVLTFHECIRRRARKRIGAAGAAPMHGTEEPRQQPDAATELPEMIWMLPGIGAHPVGSTLYDPNGNELTVLKSYGLSMVEGQGMRAGYVCQAEDGKRYFFAAWWLRDADGYVTHIQPVKSPEERTEGYCP